MDNWEVEFRRYRIPKKEVELLKKLEELSLIKKFLKVSKSDWKTRMGFSV